MAVCGHDNPTLIVSHALWLPLIVYLDMSGLAVDTLDISVDFQSANEFVKLLQYSPVMCLVRFNLC